MRRLICGAALAAVVCSPPVERGEFALRVAVPGQLAPFAPDVSSSYTTAAVDLVYQGLVAPGGDGSLAPALADRWERAGPSRYRMTLRRDARFSDGSPVALSDVAVSLARAGLSVEERGEWLEIEPAAGKGPAEMLLLYALVHKAGPAPLGTGPYAFVEGDAQHIVLKRVRPDPGRIARVEIVAYPSPRDCFARLLRGEANAMLALDERQRELLDGIPQIKTLGAAGPHAVALFMNASRLDLETRRRLAAALSAPEIAAAYGPGCRADRASALRVPLPTGRPLGVLTSSEAGFARLALAARRSLGKRGGEVEVEDVVPFEERRARLDYDLAVAPLLAWPPSFLASYFQTRGPWNWSGYSNGAFDRSMARGDLAGARAELERDPPAAIVCRRDRYLAVDARIRNPSVGAWGFLETLPDWEVSP